MPAVWVTGGRNAVNVYDLRDAITKEPILDATVAAQLLDPGAGNIAIGGSLFSCPLVDASLAHYGGTSPELALTYGKNYLVEVKATKAGSIILWDWIPVVAGKGSGV